MNRQLSWRRRKDSSGPGRWRAPLKSQPMAERSGTQVIARRRLRSSRRFTDSSASQRQQARYGEHSNRSPPAISAAGPASAGNCERQRASHRRSLARHDSNSRRPSAATAIISSRSPSAPRYFRRSPVSQYCSPVPSSVRRSSTLMPRRRAISSRDVRARARSRRGVLTTAPASWAPAGDLQGRSHIGVARLSAPRGAARSPRALFGFPQCRLGRGDLSARQGYIPNDHTSSVAKRAVSGAVPWRHPVDPANNSQLTSNQAGTGALRKVRPRGCGCHLRQRVGTRERRLHGFSLALYRCLRDERGAPHSGSRE
jgi:hypothetical protein